MITIAHSPDTDDFFLFWAIARQKIDLKGLNFQFSQHDTRILNRLAANCSHDVVAISLAAYPMVRENYLILPHGASIGRGYGPVLVSKLLFPIESINDMRVGIPGDTTTAAAVLRELAPDVKTVEYSIEPFNVGFSALERQEIDALLLIHEGQISYGRRNLNLIVDLGKWWCEKTGLPLPLGVNAIRKDLGPELISKVSFVLRASIKYALEHKQDVLRDLVGINLQRNADVSDHKQICQYLDMYANRDSLELTEDCKRAISLLIAKLTGLLPESIIEYAP
ncbi:MAG: ABC transporter substrate-binding protein [Deltaproteobacteria bacterium]|nr:ABC transporter substrate-binding protein [Deltaproteobacteria bacterium]